MAEARGTARGFARWIVLVVVLIIAATGVIVWTTSGHESTDDAQIEGRITPIAARVGGPVAEVRVKDHEYVESGAVLAQIDQTEYLIEVDRARAELADAQANALAADSGIPIAEASTSSGVSLASGGLDEARAGIAVAERQVDAARAQLTAAEARLRERQANADQAAKDVERFRPLVAKQEIAQQQFDSAVTAAAAARAAADAARSDVAAATTAVAVAEQRLLQAKSAADRAQAALHEAETAPEQLKVSRARAAAAGARVKQAEASLAQAEFNLARTTITAPSAGVVGRKSVEVGQIVQPGQPLMALVSRDDVWVVANFKETQLADMREGQAAEVDVDLLGGRAFTGRVESLAAATGAKFSLLPPENASGNFVKVVQRVPVKILLDPGQDPDHRLRPGLSVKATVRTK